MNKTAAELIKRSNKLGSDPTVTNYAGGNTSAKGTEIDPVTGEPVELLWVKGSGGDLGTLTEAGLAVLRLDRFRKLVDVYPGVDREDEMVAAFDYALHGKGGAAPSIDTAMHGLVDAAHVDHLHPDAGIAIATAKDGEKLTKRIYGDKVVWVPWRRPGFQLGLDIAAIKRDNPQAIGCILGGHGITAWGKTSAESQKNSLWIIRTAEEYLEANGKEDPFGKPRKGYGALPSAERRARAAALAPTIRGLASHDSPMVGHFTDSDVGAGLPRQSAKAPKLAELGTSCPDHFLRTKVEADAARPPGRGAAGEGDRAAEGAARGVPQGLHGVLRAARRRPTARSAMRGADPLIVLVPGVGDVQLRRQQADRASRGRVLRQRDQRDARRRGGLDVPADRGGREVPHRVLGARGGEARAAAEAEVARHPHRARHRCRVRNREGHRDPPCRGGSVRRDRRPRPREGAGHRSRARRHAMSRSACR